MIVEQRGGCCLRCSGVAVVRTPWTTRAVEPTHRTANSNPTAVRPLIDLDEKQTLTPHSHSQQVLLARAAAVAMCVNHRLHPRRHTHSHTKAVEKVRVCKRCENMCVISRKVCVKYVGVENNPELRAALHISMVHGVISVLHIYSCGPAHIRHAKTSVHQPARAAARAMRRQRLYHTTTNKAIKEHDAYAHGPPNRRPLAPAVRVSHVCAHQTPPSLLAPGVPRRVCPRPRPQHKSTHGIHKQQMRPNAMFYLLQRPPTATRARPERASARGAPRAPDARLSRRAS